MVTMPIPDMPEYRVYVTDMAALHSLVVNQRMYNLTAWELYTTPRWRIFRRMRLRAEVWRFTKWSVAFLDDALQIEKVE